VSIWLAPQVNVLNTTLHFNLVTLFPSLFDSFVNTALIKRAVDKGLISIKSYNPRDYTDDKFKRVDDSPYGGGAGMVLMVEPLFKCINHIKNTDPQSYVIYLSASGRQLTQEIVMAFSKNYKSFTLVAGRYEGIDERFVELCVDEEIALGSCILMGGEVPAMAFIEAVSRFIPNVLGNSESLSEETFQKDPLLGEYPQYTKPQNFNGLSVPEVLLSGNHEEIKRWRTSKLKRLDIK
jgi:tRNA (guanine37-N1)-methyltransferase